MAKNIVELLEDAIAEVKNLEENNKTLAEEVGKLGFENIKLKKEIENLRRDVEKWQSIATAQK